MSALFPSSCADCGARTEPGQSRCPAHLTGTGRPGSCELCGARTINTRRCPLHPVTEAERLARFPYRRGYRDPEYLRNKQRRYIRCGGRCECGCGLDLPQGWHCDHVIPLKDLGSNDVENLRCYTPGHHNPKTRADRRRRKLAQEEAP